MMSEEQPPQYIHLDPIKYIELIIHHVDKKIVEGQEFLEQKNYVEAQEKFDNALNHYEVHRKDLTKLQLTLTPSVLDLSSDDYQVQQDNYIDKLNTLIKTVKKLILDRNHNASDAEKQAQEIKRLADLVIAEEHKTKLERQLSQINQDIHNLNTSRTDTGNIIDRDSSENPVQSALNMSILAGFITALGITAVAIAFATLNLAGLAMPGVALAGFGLVTTAIGCSIFCSSSKNIDEFTDNIYKSFYTSTA